MVEATHARTYPTEERARENQVPGVDTMITMKSIGLRLMPQTQHTAAAVVVCDCGGAGGGHHRGGGGGIRVVTMRAHGMMMVHRLSPGGGGGRKAVMTAGIGNKNRMMMNGRARRQMDQHQYGEPHRREGRRRLRVESALLDPPQFNPSKLQVFYLPGVSTCAVDEKMFVERKYTLTHNDLTGSLKLSIGREYNDEQLSGWYTRILRDEILAEWVVDEGMPKLHVYCHVSGQESWPAPPGLRSFIFQREMKLVLDTIAYADREIIHRNKDMADACVFVHLASNIQPLNQVVRWGTLGDRSSWQEKPHGTLLELLLSEYTIPYASQSKDDVPEEQTPHCRESGVSEQTEEEQGLWLKPNPGSNNKVVLRGVPSMVPANITRPNTDKVK